jgi:periplasmic protein CpxP/Spy
MRDWFRHRRGRLCVGSATRDDRFGEFHDGEAMKNPRLIRTLALTLLGVTTLSVAACHRHRTVTERADWLVNKISKDLELNEQQQAKLAAVKDAFLVARGQMRTEHDALFDEALAMVQSDQLDQAKVLQLVERHQALQRQAAPSVVAKLTDFHASLSPEQRAKAVEQLKRFRERMHGHD